ncbi:MAG: hypothetical protein ABI851_00715 [Saprospiraceae bacterium]
MHKLLFFALSIFLLSCSKGNLISESKKIVNSSWNENQAITFKWNCKDSLTKYDLIISIKHTDKIPTQNIYVKCTSISPDSSFTEQIVSLEFLDNKGIPFGSCTFGNCKLNIVLASHIYFPKPGDYSLIISPYSRIAEIPGIDEIGLSIEASLDK